MNPIMVMPESMLAPTKFAMDRSRHDGVGVEPERPSRGAPEFVAHHAKSLWRIVQDSASLPSTSR